MVTPSERARGDEPANPAAVPVVGIGASAGGIAALEALVPAIHPDDGVAYVIVQHLDPHHQSSLTQLLDRLAKVPVSLINEETVIEPDHVYVIPPNAA